MFIHLQGSPQKKKSSGCQYKNLNAREQHNKIFTVARARAIKILQFFFICVVCLTVCVPSPYFSIRQSYVILIEFEWNGLKVSEVDSLDIEICENKKVRLF